MEATQIANADLITTTANNLALLKKQQAGLSNDNNKSSLHRKLKEKKMREKQLIEQIRQDKARLF